LNIENKIMKCQNKMKHFLLGLVLVLGIFGCKDKHEELANHKGSEYILELKTSKSSNHVDRESYYGSDKIILENEIFKNCLASLLDKDASLVTFENPRKGDVMVTANYENLRQNVSIKETKRAFLIALKEAMKFKLIEEYPENKYQLLIKNNILMKNNLSINTKDTSSVYSGPGIFKAYNSSILAIANGLNNTYKDSAFFVTDSTDNNRYTFEIENIPFDKLKPYLEHKIGLSFVTMDKVKGTKTTTRVVFND
jgi:hypothetical protein